MVGGEYFGPDGLGEQRGYPKVVGRSRRARDAETARRLVVRGFFADVVQRIGLDALQDRLMGTIETRLGALPGLEDQQVKVA